MPPTARGGTTGRYAPADAANMRPHLTKGAAHFAAEQACQRGARCGRGRHRRHDLDLRVSFIRGNRPDIPYVALRSADLYGEERLVSECGLRPVVSPAPRAGGRRGHWSAAGENPEARDPAGFSTDAGSFIHHTQSGQSQPPHGQPDTSAAWRIFLVLSKCAGVVDLDGKRGAA